MKILRIVLLVITIALAGYGLITNNFAYNSYLILLVGAFMLVTGLVELQKERKKFEGFIFIIVSLFLFFVSISVFLLN